MSGESSCSHENLSGNNERIVNQGDKKVDHIRFKITTTVSSTLKELIETIKAQNVVKEMFSKEDLTKYSFHVSDYRLVNIENVKLSDLCSDLDEEKLVIVNVIVKFDTRIIFVSDICDPESDDDTIDENNMFIKWKRDITFLKIQQSIHMDKNPKKWTTQHVLIWLKCVAITLKINGIKYDLCKEINGEKLCKLTVEEFENLVPFDHNKILWTHLFILKKRKCFAMVDFDIYNQFNSQMQDLVCQSYVKFDVNKLNNSTKGKQKESLCKFFYDLLENQDHTDIIQWIDKNELIFKIVDPYVMSIIWGFSRKVYGYNLNYFKLAVALKRDPKFSKVVDKAHVWKFVDNIEILEDS